MMEAAKKNTGYDEKQMTEARGFCGILSGVPAERRGVFLAVANAYMDGMAAGQAIAGAKK